MRLGTKYAEPTIEDGVADPGRGRRRPGGRHRAHPPPVVARRRASTSGGPRPRRGGRSRPLALTPIPSWHRADGFARLLADRTADALAALRAGGHTRTAVFFTAHSLPLRAVAEGDPYPDQVAESAADIAGLADLDASPG